MELTNQQTFSYLIKRPFFVFEYEASFIRMFRYEINEDIANGNIFPLVTFNQEN